MKFRMRLILSYTILACVASFIIGLVYNHYLTKRYENSIYSSAQYSSSQLLNKMDDSLRQMEQAAQLLLSDQDAVVSIRELSTLMAEPEKNETLIAQDKDYVRNVIYTSYNYDNFYRIIVFNQHGYIGASAIMQDRVVNTETDVKNISWLSDITNTHGKMVLVGQHLDDWSSSKRKAAVFSLVKEIQGNNLGYIEVQQTTDYLKNIFDLPDENVKVIALKPDNQVLYASEGIALVNYRQYMEKEDYVSEERNEKTDKNELISIQTSKDSGVRLILVEDWEKAMAGKTSGISTAFLIGGVFLLVSLLFIFLMSDLLTRPLRELRRQMERTQWTNLDRQIKVKSSDQDVQALTNAYQNLMNRLDSSIEKERKLGFMQLQAQFDTLQAQINPHFLYNVLNVISNRGIQNDDEIVCEMCAHLASMLRYSTNTKERYANIGQEIEYLNHYVYLLKARFEDRLHIEIDVMHELYQKTVPKILIQQLVENSIDHGYTAGAQEMRIKVQGRTCENGWRIDVLDNGCGMTVKKQKELEEKISAIRCKLEKRNENLEFEIGGMGLANSYGRMYLLYQDAVTFQVKNREDGAGVMAVIGVEEECIQS